MSDEMSAGLVADGRQRQIKAFRREIVKEIRQRYAAELERAGMFERMRLEARIREEIRAALLQTFAPVPPEALF